VEHERILDALKAMDLDTIFSHIQEIDGKMVPIFIVAGITMTMARAKAIANGAVTMEEARRSAGQF